MISGAMVSSFQKQRPGIRLFNGKHLYSVPFDDQDGCWFHFSTAAATATLAACFFFAVYASCTEAKGDIYKRNENRITDMYSLADDRFYFDHILEIFKDCF